MNQMRRRPIELTATALLFAVACGPALHAPAPATERVVAVNANGSVVRQSMASETATTTFPAPLDRVWTALVLSYADIGVDPTISDPASGRYGNEGFIAPRRLLDHPLGELFSCGSGLGGAHIDHGRLYVYMVTTVSPAGAGTTNAGTHVTAKLMRNEGTSNEPVRCSSSGRLEEALRLHVAQHLADKG